MYSEKLRLGKLKNFLKELTSQRKPLSAVGDLEKMLKSLSGNCTKGLAKKNEYISTSFMMNLKSPVP